MEISIQSEQGFVQGQGAQAHSIRRTLEWKAPMVIPHGSLPFPQPAEQGKEVSEDKRYKTVEASAPRA